MFKKVSYPGSLGFKFFAAGDVLRVDCKTFMFRPENDDGWQRLLKHRLRLTFWTQSTAKLVRALHEKSGQANVWCYWLKQILKAWLAYNVIVEDEEGVFVLVNEDGMGFTTFIGSHFDLL